MAPFYSRYVPDGDTTTTKPVNDVSELPTKKRKRNLESEKSEQVQDRKKSRTSISESHDSPLPLKEAKKDRANLKRGPGEPERRGSKNLSSSIEKAELSVIALSGEGHSVEQRQKKVTSEVTQRRTPNGPENRGKSKDISNLDQNLAADQGGGQSKTGKVKKKKNRRNDRDIPEAGDESPANDDDGLNQHASMKSKFEKATKKSVDILQDPQSDLLDKQREASPPEELHGLEPLPQPPLVEKPVEKPSFSSLPKWLANPLRVDPARSTQFADLALDAVMLENVQNQGLTKAFSVQAAVLPLLMDGPHHHQGDICISAATGSGKTLAYVLPMIHKLSTLAAIKLRALIVVPTRELVRQAKEVCEACAAGTKVKIATAVGSKTLNDEQELLVERYEIYDPKEYQRRQTGQVDWTQIELAEVLSDVSKEEELAHNFVPKYRSKVDVLICTPGRLIDHIRSTKGFTLDDVQWLVIDEADRLLNESFQEWTSTVIPALQSRASHTLQDSVLKTMGLDIPERVVQKVILSATMTQDISKLNSLKLQNPKLVIVGEVNTRVTDTIEEFTSEPQKDEASSFSLPTTLSEYAVYVGDGADKPLYLLELLRRRVNVFGLQSSDNLEPSTDQDSDISLALDSDSDSDSHSDSVSTSSSSNSSTTCSHPAIRRSKRIVANKQPNPTNNTALIFTRSTESATRLRRLLSLLSTPISSLTATITKSSTSSSTRKALTNFRQHKIRILIATDRASRGLDLPDLGHVISYDVPTSMTSYVHRVGRTARAGKFGDAWTLLAHREARWFWTEIGKGVGEMGRIVRSGKVKRVHLDIDAGKDDGTKERYEKALKTLGEEVNGREVNGTQ